KLVQQFITHVHSVALLLDREKRPPPLSSQRSLTAQGRPDKLDQRLDRRPPTANAMGPKVSTRRGGHPSCMARFVGLGQFSGWGGVALRPGTWSSVLFAHSMIRLCGHQKVNMRPRFIC